MLMLSQALTLWGQGIWESLQLHRCVVLFVLDNSNNLWSRVARCLFLNGCLFLGSIAWWSFCLGPAIHLLLSRLVEPCWGPSVASAAESSLCLAFDVLLLLPIYITTMLASSVEYQQVAAAACAVQQQRASARLAGQAGSRAAAQSLRGPAACGSGGGAAAASGEAGGLLQGGAGGPPPQPGVESVAQELFRVVFFFVHYLEVWLLGSVPYLGKGLYFLLMTWLWAYYCFDYKWSLQSVRLADRLDFFEARWAFFGGFGTIMAAATVCLPFYWAAACSALLFPLFIIVACDSEPEQVVYGGRTAGLARIPIFWLALRPTQSLLRYGMRRV